MGIGQDFTRATGFGLALGLIDAIVGRVFQAAPDPSVVLSLGGTLWMAYAFAVNKRSRFAFPAGVAFWVAFMAAFWVCARVLVGWNGSVAWHPPSMMWMVKFALSAPIMALVGQILGSRAALRAKREASPPG